MWGNRAAVADTITRLEHFLDTDVAELTAALASETAGRPAVEADGTLSTAVWQARREVARRSAAAGFYNLHLPTDVGGGGLSRAGMFHIEEAVYARGLGLGPATLAWTEGPSPLVNYFSEDQQARFGRPLTSGDATTAFALTELGAGSDVRGIGTSARRDGDEWVISGHKAFITNAQYCDFAQVTAVTDPETRELTMFLVEADSPGFRRGDSYRTIMHDGLTGELFFDDVRVPDANRVGDIGQGLGLAMTWINWRRLCRGGMCAGWGRYLIDRSLARTRERSAFGAPLAKMQAVRHMLAEMYTRWFQARAASIDAQDQLDRIGPFEIPLDPAARPLISLVKLVNDSALFRVADLGVQLHGASGLLDDSPEATMFRIARNLRIPAGTDEIQKNTIGAGLLSGGIQQTNDS